jgi:HSP20 family protein
MAGQGQWDPLKELTAVQKRMNRLFESALGMADFETQEEPDSWTPVCDVYETADALVVSLELPGLEQSHIDVRVDGDDLVVSGEREIEREQAGEQFHRVERPYGKFSRRFHLPSTVNREAIGASFRDGLLRVTLPNQPDKQRRPIRVAIR